VVITVVLRGEVPVRKACDKRQRWRDDDSDNTTTTTIVMIVIIIITMVMMMMMVVVVATVAMTKGILYEIMCNIVWYFNIYATRYVSHYRCGMDLPKTLHDWLFFVAMFCPIQSSQQEIHCCLYPQALRITSLWISHTLPLTKVFSMEINLLAVVLAM